ncbi:MAG TPA: transposase, partial [Roseiflexaceae bacterium]
MKGRWFSKLPLDKQDGIYIFRVALSNNRIIRVADDQVTFRYTVGATGQTKYSTLPAEVFIQRFL